MNKDNKINYDSKALTLDEWNKSKDIYSDWEYKIVRDIVYLRKHVSGDVNVVDTGWNVFDAKS